MILFNLEKAFLYSVYIKFLINFLIVSSSSSINQTVSTVLSVSSALSSTATTSIPFPTQIDDTPPISTNPGPGIKAITGSVKLFSEKHLLTVDDQPYHIRGIAYSPIPIGESPSYVPGGDYFTVDYQYLWKRDLPLIKAMGANTIRIYSWSPIADHLPFLDAVYQSGLRVVITHYLGTEDESPVDTPEAQDKVIEGFVQQAKRYGDHPAILMWMFGNELNGPWNGFMSAFNKLHNCKWTLDCTTNRDKADSCYQEINCVYSALFNFIEKAIRTAKQYTTRPMITGFADLDNLIAEYPDTDRAPRFAHLVESMDAIAVQLYRGSTFGNYFDLFAAEMNSSLIISEYGVDSYNDACGWPENFGMQPCSNFMGDGRGGSLDIPGFVGCSDTRLNCTLPGEAAQVNYDLSLANEVENQFKNSGVVLGGFLMSWVDEYWKGVGTQDQCLKTSCPLKNITECLTIGKDFYAVNGPAGCTWKAHISCPNYNTSQQDLCGYWLSALPDGYVNEQWFGINEVSLCHPLDLHVQGQQYNLNSLRLKPVYQAISKLWNGIGSTFDAYYYSAQCSALEDCYTCTRSHSFRSLVLENACQTQCGFQFSGFSKISTNTPPVYNHTTAAEPPNLNIQSSAAKIQEFVNLVLINLIGIILTILGLMV